MLGSPSLAPTKLDEIKIKVNILSAFAAKKLDQATDAASSAATEATDAVKDTAGQAAEGVEAFAEMMKEMGGKVKGEL